MTKIKNKYKVLPVSRTQKGVPFLWESTSKYPDEGLVKTSTVLNKDFGFKGSVFQNINSNKTSVVPIDVEDVIVKTFMQNGVVSISLLVINDISARSNEIKVGFICRINDLPSDFENAENAIRQELQKLYPLPVVDKIIVSLERVYDKVDGTKVILNEMFGNIMEKYMTGSPKTEAVEETTEEEYYVT